MNQIIQFHQTMTSREIAAATGKRHDNVLRDIRTMLDEIDIELAEGVSSDLRNLPRATHYEQIDPQNGQAYPEYSLDRRLTLTLVSGYSAKLRYAVVCRMEALESIVLEQKLTDHGQTVRERAIIETNHRAIRVQNELRAEIEELKRQIQEDDLAE